MEAIRNKFAVSLQGASHIKKEELAKNTKEERSFPCQDKSSSRFFPQDDSHKTPYYLTVACDGHGGTPYFRSAKGAELAISSIEKILPTHIDEVATMLSESNRECLCQLVEEYQKKIISLIVPSLLTEWKNEVASHLAENPITEKELEFLEMEKKQEATHYRKAMEESDLDKKKELLCPIYGSTFLCVVVAETFWFALQIGDGDIALHDENGFFMPVPEDERIFLNFTTSLCDKNAEHEFRIALGTNKIDAVICSTDGIANSFANKEKLISFYGRVLFIFRVYESSKVKEYRGNDWKEVARKRAEFAENEIKLALPDISKLGSGDDVTLAGFVDIREDDVKTAFLAIKLIEEGKKASAGSSEAEKKFLEAAKMGSSEACYEVGCMLSTKSPNEAIEYLEKALEGGIEEAKEKLIPLIFEVAKSFQKEKKHTEAFKYFLKAAQYGIKEAQYEVSLYFGRPQDYENCGVRQDFAKAIMWTFEAANQGYALAECKLGKCYRDGRGIQQDAQLSFEWYKKASEHGSLEAQDYLKQLEKRNASKAIKQESPLEAFEYEVRNGKYILKKLKDVSLTDVVIPRVFSKIEKEAFGKNSNLINITIPASITKIGKWAFYNCSNLKDVSIPTSITEIEDGAFSECSNLKTITIPDSVVKIGNSAFYACSSLTSITIPNSVIQIEPSAFSLCLSLKDITIPASVSEIATETFENCLSLASVTIPDSVTRIGVRAFEHCSSLTSVTIPNSVTKIEEEAFWGCSGLTSVVIPDSITEIEKGAFSGCSGLTSVVIPYSVTEIGEGAFSGCTFLKHVIFEGKIFEWNINITKSLISHIFGPSPSFSEIKIGNKIVKISDLDQRVSLRSFVVFFKNFLRIFL